MRGKKINIKVKQVKVQRSGSTDVDFEADFKTEPVSSMKLDNDAGFSAGFLQLL